MNRCSRQENNTHIRVDPHTSHPKITDNVYNLGSFVAALEKITIDLHLACTCFCHIISLLVCALQALSIPYCQSTCLSVILSVCLSFCPYVHASSLTSGRPIFMKPGT